MSTYLDPKSAVGYAKQYLAPLSVDAKMDDRDNQLFLWIEGTSVEPIERRRWATQEDLERLCASLHDALR